MAVSFRNIRPTRDLPVCASFSRDTRLLSLTGRIVDTLEHLGELTKIGTGVWGADSVVTDRALGESRMYTECEEIGKVDMRGEGDLTIQQDQFYEGFWSIPLERYVKRI